MGNDTQDEKGTGNTTRMRLAEERTERAEARAVQAKTRTELAETRTEQAESRTELAKTRTEQAEIRTEQAEMRSDQAVRDSELGYRRLFEAAREGILILEADTGRISDVNPFLIQLLGFSQGEVIGTSIWELGAFKDIVANKAKFEQLHEQGYVRCDNLTLETREGRKIAVEFVSNVYQAGNRNVIQCNVRDITEAKKIEARFRRLVDSNAQGVIFFNTKGGITGANDAFLQLVRYNREDLEAARISWVALTPPEYAELDHHALGQIATSGTCVPYEKEFIRKDGSRVPILMGAAAFEDDPDEGVCFVLDLTERKKLEGQFRQSQKMEAIGQLAGGVAHDFNNILAVIQLQADLLQTGDNLSTEQVDLAGEIGTAAQRAAGLTRQLLLFGRKETLQPRDLDLNQSINNTTKMLRRILGEDIQMQFKFAMEPLLIHADAGMMDQVLMNLAVNSRDAMAKGGQLIIETSAAHFDASVGTYSPEARPGSFVCLGVSDNGCGIAPEIISRIFEPFFTTKDVGKGTGLGLATVFGIIQQHRGWINVYSEVGRGTTFRIYLPRLAAASLQKPESPPVASPRGGNETILLVEDDTFLRASLHRTLAQLGYHVHVAINGIDALELWEQKRDEIQLLLTDLVMPGGITGKDLGERLLRENPRLKVIYTSGYSAELAARDFHLEEGVNFLIKPFEAHKLAQTIRNRLDGNG